MSLAELVANAIGDLIPMPKVASEVMEKVGEEKTVAPDLDRIIRRDQALASRVLKIANSSFYGRGKAVSSVQDAVVTLGFNMLRSVVVSAAMRGMYREFGGHERALWEHSVGVALGAKVIARRVEYAQPEQAFLAGLLHDIGQTILLIKCPDKMKPILDTVGKDATRRIGELEEKAFGFDHAALGRLIARDWKFGAEIEEAIDRHHQPAGARTAPKLVQIVALANGFCHVLGIGPTRRSGFETPVMACAEALGLDSGALDELQKEIGEAIVSESAAFSG